MAEEYDLRTNKIILGGKMRKLKRLQEEIKTVSSEISKINAIIDKQEKKAGGKNDHRRTD